MDNEAATRVTRRRTPAEARESLQRQGDPLGLKRPAGKRQNGAPSVSVWEPEPARENKSVGVERVDLATGAEIQKRRKRENTGIPVNGRAFVRAIFTLPEQIERAVEELNARLGGVRQPGETMSVTVTGKGTLDKALPDHLRRALAIYVRDWAIVEGRIKIANYGQLKDSPYSVEQISRAQERMSWVREGDVLGRGAVPLAHRQFFDFVATSMWGVNDGTLPTVHEIGCQILHIENREHGRQGFIGYAIAAAEVLNESYHLWADVHFNPERRAQTLRMAIEAQVSEQAES